MKKKISKTNLYTKWQETANRWQVFPAPLRPTLNECQIYKEMVEKVLKGKKKPKILLLGATPEIRDMLFTQTILRGATIYLLDISPVMIKAMSEILGFKNPKEKAVIGNWLNMPFKDKTFDVVLGDVVLENVPRERKEDFLKEIKRVLKDEGYFISRFQFVTPDLKNFKIEKSLKKYSRFYLQGKINFKQLVMFVESDLWRSSYYKEDGASSLASYEKDLRHFRNSTKNPLYKLVIDKLLDYFKFVLKNKWYLFEKNKLDKFLRKHFSVRSIKYPNDHYFAKVCPIYLLKKIYFLDNKNFKL